MLRNFGGRKPPSGKRAGCADGEAPRPALSDLLRASWSLLDGIWAILKGRTRGSCWELQGHKARIYPCAAVVLNRRPRQPMSGTNFKRVCYHKGGGPIK